MTDSVNGPLKAKTLNLATTRSIATSSKVARTTEFVGRDVSR